MPGRSASWRKPFFVLWVGQSVSLLGSGLTGFALVWWLTVQTGQASTLALASIMNLLPFVVLGPFAGVLVDKWSRKWVLIVADGSIALLTLGLAVLFRFGNPSTWHVFAIMSARSLGGAFHRPALGATTPLMVPKEHLTRVGRMNNSVQGVIQYAGPALGAFMLTLFDIEAVLLIDVMTAAVAIAGVTATHIPRPDRTVRSNGRSTAFGRVIQELSDGFRYMWSARGVRALVLTSVIWGVVASPAPTFLPILVTDRFGRGVEYLGLMQSMLALGIAAGGLLLTVWGGCRRKLYTSLIGTLGLTLGGSCLGLSPAHTIWIPIVGITVIGLALPLHGAPLGAIFQTVIPNELQGRFFSLQSAISSVLGPISLAVAGPLADAVGVRIFYIIHPIGALIVVGLRFFSKSIRTIEEETDASVGVVPHQALDSA